MIAPKITIIKLIDVSFTAHPGISIPEQIISAHKEGFGYVDFIRKHFDVIIVEHMNYEGEVMIHDFHYSFFNTRNKFFYVPFKTLRYIKKEKPEVVVVQGLKFPLQTILLRLFLNRKCKIIAQHHAEKPFEGIKLIFQRIADKFIDAYLFTAAGNTKEWLSKNIINNTGKCHEVLEASTFFTRQNKNESKERLGITGSDIFLWVGRLEKNKDPVTILSGFEKYLEIKKQATLYMAYQENDLLAEVRSLIDNSSLLKKNVILVGKINHNELQHWFSAADFYLSGSHSEGSGYALLEALACGCIPVITDIPPFRKITGQYGFLFEPGNPDSLCAALQQASKAPKEDLSADIVSHFNDKLSFKKIADDIYDVCRALSVV